MAQQLLARYGIVTREVAGMEALPGGFSAIYPALRVLEETGRIRRGYFVANVAATQFVQPQALELLRTLREPPETPEALLLAATDPANPYGAMLPWPTTDVGTFSRAVGAFVILVNGTLGAYFRLGNPRVWVGLPDDEPERSVVARGGAGRLAEVALSEGLLIGEVNGQPVATHAIAPFLLDAGFVASALGFHVRRRR